MPVIYDSKKIIPGPFARISKEYQTLDDGGLVGSLYSIILTGTLIADRGSPATDGTFWTSSGYPSDEVIAVDGKLGAILKKQEALRKLFSVQGKTLEIQSEDGSAPMKCNPRVKRIDFQEGGQGRLSWVEKCDYTITLEADSIYINGAVIGEDAFSTKISKANEEWNIEIADDKVFSYRLTHSVSAIGKRFYDETGTLEKAAWEQAKDYVINTIGLGIKNDRMVAPDVLDANTLQAFNYFRSQHIGELSGSFQVNETWLCYAPGAEPPAIDEYNVSVRTSMDGKASVSIDGTISGLMVSNNTTGAVVSTKWENASNKWENYVSSQLYSRATSLSGFLLHATPTGTSYSANPLAGTISYHAEYDNRANSVISGAISEKISISSNAASDVYASITILGKIAGPVLQPIGAKTAKRKTVNIELVMAAKTQIYTPVEPNTDAIVLGLMPAGIFYTDNDVTNFDTDGRYTRSVTFTWV